jgi:glycosyltransferase involved in cell wall biosynthesis
MDNLSMNQAKFSVIICSINALKFAQICTCYERLLATVPHEIIGIHDAKSLAEGYNRGMAQSTGDILCFSHDDILILDPDFAEKISERLQIYDILGFAGTTRLVAGGWIGAGALRGAVAHAVPRKNFSLDVFGVGDWPVSGDIQAIDGLLMIATRAAAQATGFDAITFDGFHHYDLDFSFSAYLAGRKLGVCCDIPIIHASTGNFNHQWQQYSVRFLQKYAGKLEPIDPTCIRSTPGGRAAAFKNLHTLRAFWQEDILKRVTIAQHRRAAFRQKSETTSERPPLIPALPDSVPTVPAPD